LNGEYIGVYLIIEEITYNKKGRIDVEKTNAQIDETSFIVEIDRKPLDDTKSIETFGTYSYLTYQVGAEKGYFRIAYPNKTLTEGQKEYIILYIEI